MILIVDANILVGELLRQRGRELLRHPSLILYISEKVLDEAQYELRRRMTERINRGLSEAIGQGILDEAMSIIEADIRLVAQSNYIHLETEARNRIPRDPDDWHTVALALEMDAAIWTQDCDFLGCGCATWTAETLLIQMRTVGI
ncbi:MULTISPECIES: PIN domain-containing protein [Cyanophyceae]|uniref:PIN domain-containing protein n=1 Tax=Cyanophyceae TaxID=3028117 RepID=UPI001683E045|nr:PIN domain-containing protein [Trichocoleus sp. FACHB-69]MBD1930664.1 nucleotide-binding protein, PIN domain-containing protein [Trichocoleus sp. FACHB-69]